MSFGRSIEQTRLRTRYLRPPGQTRMKYFEPFQWGLSSDCVANLGARKDGNEVHSPEEPLRQQAPSVVFTASIIGA